MGATVDQPRSPLPAATVHDRLRDPTIDEGDTVMTIIEDRLNQLPTLKHGKHDSIDHGACLLEAVSWVVGEPFSDHPQCVCPVLGAFGRSWNDSLDDDKRNRLLQRFITRLVGTRSTAVVEERRAWMAADWLIRTYTPAWLRLAGLNDHADALAGADAVSDLDALGSVQPLIAAAWDAARDAAWATARDAAWATARDAARDAAWAAAWDAARAAAGDAARAAAWDAAGDAAGDAARAAAWAAARAATGDAARAALAPTVAELQASAVDLFERMIGVSE
jgi:hypothetical protein